MSDLSDKKPAVTESIGATAELGAQMQRQGQAGPDLGGIRRRDPASAVVRVDQMDHRAVLRAGAGRTDPDPPLHMKIPLIANAVVLWVGLPFAVWYFFIRPWRRERRITLDGMLLLSMGLMFFQDPFLNYFNTWCTYNTWLFNRGAWTPHIPGWVSPDEPGRMVPEPLLTNTPGYAYGVLLITIIGCCGHAQDQVALAEHQQLASDPGDLRDRFCLRLRDGGPGPAADRALHLSRCHPGGVVQCRHLLPMAGLRRADVGRRPDGPVLSALLHRRSRPHHRRARIGPCPRRVRPTAVHPLPGDLRSGERMLLRLLQHSRAVVRHALRPLARGPSEALVLQRRHLWRRNRNAVPRSGLPMPTRRSGFINTDGELVLPEGAEVPKTVPFERGE